MNKLKSMTTFVAIVDKGSLSAAAGHLGYSAATIVRTLAELEEHLGARLLNRTTRRIALTDEGRLYLEHCRRILAEVDEVEFMLDQRKESPVGKLNLTAPVMFGQMHIQPLLCQWLEENEGMTAELTLLDRTVDLLEEGFDTALRIGHMADSSLIAQPLGHVFYTCCASPDLIEKMGSPKHPEEIAQWPAITYGPYGNQWKFDEDGKTLPVEVKPIVAFNHISPMLEAAKRGLGVTYVMSYQAVPGIASGELVPLLGNFVAPNIPVQFLYPHRRLLSPRVKQFIDWASPKLRNVLS